MTAIWLLAVSALGICFFLWPQKEPLYDGKPLSYWLDVFPAVMRLPGGRLVSGTLDRTDIEARNAVRDLGETCLSECVRRIKFKRYVNLQSEVLKIVQKCGLSVNPRKPIDDWMKRRARALFVLEYLGGRAENILPNLKSLAADPVYAFNRDIERVIIAIQTDVSERDKVWTEPTLEKPTPTMR